MLQFHFTVFTQTISSLPFEILSTACSQCSQVPLSLNWNVFIFPCLYVRTSQFQLARIMFAIKLRGPIGYLMYRVAAWGKQVLFLSGRNNTFHKIFSSLIFIFFLLQNQFTAFLETFSYLLSSLQKI